MEPSRSPVRRIAGPNAKNRAVLCDAVERILLTEGSAAVTSRRVAAEAGLKPQLVHYYFASMDDLLVATFERMSEEGLAHQLEAREQHAPVRAMWATLSDQRGTSLLVEFVALAAHRPVLRQVITAQALRFRSMLVEAIRDAAVPVESAVPGATDPEALAVFLTAAAEIMIMERSLGLTTGHDAVRASIDDLLDQLEPLQRD